MRNNVKNPDVLKILLPSFPAGCRRFTPADAYIAALNECNVNVVKGSVTAIDRDGLIMDNGTKFHVDCIVCATGFDPYTPRFPVRGRDGHNLQEEWSIHGNYESYMATSVAGYPNFFGAFMEHSDQSSPANMSNSVQPTKLPSEWIGISRHREGK